MIGHLVRLGTAAILGGLLTAAGLEGAARLIAPQQKHDVCTPEGSLLVFRSNCVSAPIKLAEGPWIVDRTNDCGYRSAGSCRAQGPGGLRIAVVGSSVARGHFVDYPETWAGRTEVQLRQACGRPADIQNLSIARATDNNIPIWVRMADRSAEAAALHPQAILTLLTKWDIGFYHPPVGGARVQLAQPAPAGGLALLKRALVLDSRAVMLARQLLDRDAARYLPPYLQHGDDADFLRAPLSPAWRWRLDLADTAFARIADAARPSRIPWLVLFVPLYGQVALTQHRELGGKADPYLLGRAMAARVAARGGVFYDLTSDFARVPRPSSLFYIGDGHPNAAGHRLIAARVMQLLAINAPAFARCRMTR